MSITERDRKILMAIVPLLVALGYWFLLLAPKRDEAAKAGDELAKQEQRRDVARQQADRLASAKTSFASDYTELVRLGKAVPTSVDMPSLIVQLDSAARGTGIHFTRIATADASGSGGSTTSSTQPPAAPGTGNGSQPAAAGGAPAQSGTGKMAEKAGDTVNAANSASSAAEKSGVNPGDTQTSSSARKGGLPVGGGSGSGQAGGGKPGAGAPGLDAVPLQLEFQGGFFELADFFHRMKRFVRVVNDRVLVSGRLLTVDSLDFTSDPQSFPRLTAQMNATVYLAPKAQGTRAGATPRGPATTVPASGAAAPGGGSSTSTPTATAVPKP